MKKWLLWILIAAIAVFFLYSVFMSYFGPDMDIPDELRPPGAWDKPVIYLYPEAPTEVTVELILNGELLVTYPQYTDPWRVLAQPNGALTDVTTGKEYSYLFWEGKVNAEYDMTAGFVVAGTDTAEFLQTTLAQMGLTPKEYNEFIVYWLPQMQNNPYNLITFQQETYTDNAVLNISPKPDSMLRVFMAWKPLQEKIDIPEPQIDGFERKGFTVVEWGGTQIKD